MKKPDKIAWYIWNQLGLYPEETIGFDHLDMAAFVAWMVE